MLKFLSRASLVLGGWSIFAMADICSPNLSVNPFLYQIEKDSQTGYLLGIYTPGIRLDELPDYVRAAIYDSTIQVGEVDSRFGTKHLAALALTILNHFDRKHSGLLKRELTSDELEFLKMRLRAYGKAESSVNDLTLFGAALYAMHSAGDEHEPSLRDDIANVGQKAGLIKLGLENPLANARSKIKGFDVAFLKHIIAQERAIDSFAPRKPQHEEIKLFRAGNEDAFAAYKARWSEARPKSFRYLMAERVQNWLPEFESKLSHYGRPFFYVGAMHLVEPNGVLQGLRERGYTVTRVEP